MADAKPADIQDLLGGALFKALYKWMRESGPVYLLPTGQYMQSRCILELSMLLCSFSMQKMSLMHAKSIKP